MHACQVYHHNLFCPMYHTYPPPGDFMRDFSTKLVPLLEDDIRVMIYAGVWVGVYEGCAALRRLCRWAPRSLHSL